MEDTTPTSDDISALWGKPADGLDDRRPPVLRPGNNGAAIEPAPAPAAVARLDAVEDDVRRLTRAFETFCGALEAKVAEELARQREATAVTTDARLAQLEAQLTARLEQVSHATGPADADRLDVVKRQLREAVTGAGRPVDAEVARHVAEAEAKAVAAANARVALFRAHVEERFAAIDDQIAQIADAQDRTLTRAELKEFWDRLRATVGEHLAKVRDEVAASVAASERDMGARLGRVEEALTLLSLEVKERPPDYTRGNRAG